MEVDIKSLYNFISLHFALNENKKFRFSAADFSATDRLTPDLLFFQKALRVLYNFVVLHLLSHEKKKNAIVRNLKYHTKIYVFCSKIVIFDFFNKLYF